MENMMDISELVEAGGLALYLSFLTALCHTPTLSQLPVIDRPAVDHHCFHWPLIYSMCLEFLVGREVEFTKIKQSAVPQIFML